MFTPSDLSQIEAHGLTPEAAERQIRDFKRGFPYLHAVRPATAGDGILRLGEAQADRAVARYDMRSAGLDIVKFVPASGAATRMFKDLYTFLSDGRRTEAITRLFAQIERFAFWPELSRLLPADADDRTVVEAIVGAGLGYGSLPKGLVTFHRYPKECRKAVEEHLVEGAAYAASGNLVRLHFTVSPEHRPRFEALLAQRMPVYEQRYGVRYEVGFSAQKPSTDTIAVDADFLPFRRQDGTLLFRPAGHGALIENLDEIDADLIFIKNIDNVTTDARRGDTIRYKKVLAGLLLSLQERAWAHLDALERGCDPAPAARFLTDELCVKLPTRANAALVRGLLDRPLRVCGMVRNEGEPGGGPFWVANGDGTESLQIAESSQIAPRDAALLQRAAYFNPVDLVCATRDRRGRHYDLHRYVDSATGFISFKSSGGRELRALELPGLWNGAMAHWNTVFAEVPITTFSPVKVVYDLLRPEHQES